jgi:glycosyltransferase involved in cell wall biosynthesis
MLNKIVYIVKSNLHYYPPCVSEIRLLKDLNIDVTVWYGSSNESALKLLKNEGIECVELTDPRNKYKGKVDKLNNWILFRKAVIKELKRISKEDTVIWFGTAETAIPLSFALRGYNYILTSLELLDDNYFKRKAMGHLAQNAKAIVACEETRAYIMKYWWNLDKLPYVMPNKPHDLYVTRYVEPSCNVTSNAINEVKDKKFIIYQGIFQNVEYLTALAEALNRYDSKYYFVMMGIDKNNIFSVVKEIYDKAIYISSIPAPLHLEVTSHAHIGIAFYDGSTLNKAFCAPNKIYEYAGFGIPIIGNRIPGLINTIGAIGAGECVDFTVDSLYEAIKSVDEHYEDYSRAALDFFSNTDNLKIMKNIVCDLEIKREV